MCPDGLGWILGDIEVYDPSAVVADHSVEKPKRRGWHNEHVDRRNVGQVVVQEATPSRGGDQGPSPSAPHDRPPYQRIVIPGTS